VTTKRSRGSQGLDAAPPLVRRGITQEKFPTITEDDSSTTVSETDSSASDTITVPQDNDTPPPPPTKEEGVASRRMSKGIKVKSSRRHPTKS
jgi:hypothetical protein